MAEAQVIKFSELANFSERQQMACDTAMSETVKYMLYGGALGGGKASNINSLVATPFGFRRMGDLEVGDTICNPTGQPQKIIAVHPQGIKPIYKIMCNDGASTECTLDHLWLVNKTQRHRKIADESYFTGYSFFGGKIWTTAQVKDFLDSKAPGKHNSKQNLLIPLCNPLKFTKSYRPEYNKKTIAPYLLGVLIGDGSITQTNISFATIDPEIVAYIRGLGYEVTDRKDISHGVKNVKGDLEKLGLWGHKAETKFIPECYKWGSLEERKELVCGLVDTDGYVDGRGHLSYTTISYRLAEDFQWIIRSLGGKATITDRIPTFTHNGEKRIGQKAYTVYFRTKIDNELVKLPRKIERLSDKNFNNGLGEFSRAIVSVEYIGDQEAQCITVDNPNGLYITDDFIVTHNSYFLRWFCVRYLLYLAKNGFCGVNSMLACEDYPSLKDRQLQKIGQEFPPWLGKSHSDHKEYGRSFILAPEYGSGVICFRNLDDTSKYQSAEFALICVDELTKNVYEVFTFLRSRLRWPGLEDFECKFIGATNPGGIGHGWVKQFWMDSVFPDEWIHPIDFRPQFVYVPSKASDNPYLDPSYWAQLQTLPENLRKAFRDGDWDIFVGQAFPEFSKAVHVIRPIPVPSFCSLYMTYDWGYGAPFSIGWWWVDNDGRVYRFAEWYGWNGTANQGLRMSDSQVAEGIIEREERLNIRGRDITRLCDPTSFNKKPDYKGGGQGPSTADVFAGYGLYLAPGDPSRQLKKRQFHERLRALPGEKPMMLIYNTCEQFIRTLPNLVIDENNVEDVDTTGEDHVYDESAQIVMARPLRSETQLVSLSSTQRIADFVTGKTEIPPWEDIQTQGNTYINFEE